MSKPDLAIDGMNVVLVGRFKPLEITPRWLRQEDLIGAEDYDSYEIEAVSPTVTIVRFGSIRLQVVPDNLQVSTDAADDVEATRDLVTGILLSGANQGIAAMGINRGAHFAADPGCYHAIGDRITPKDLWDDVLYLPGMQSVGITGSRSDGYGGTINVQVPPSPLVQPGVFVTVNDHYTLNYVDPPSERSNLTAAEAIPPVSEDKVSIAVKILTEGFVASRAASQEIINRVFSFGNKPEDGA